MSNKEHLTAATVEAIVKAGGRMSGNRLVREIGDLHTKGLELRVRSPGRAHWSVRYRVNGVSRRYDIGPTSAVGLREARDAVADLRSKLARSIDPVAEAEDARRAQEQARAAEDAERVAAAARITVADAVERYIAHSVRQSAKRQKGPPRERIRTLRIDLLPALGDMKLADLSNDAVMALVSEAERQGFERKPSKLYDEMRAFLSWATSTTPKLLATSPLTSPRPEQNAPRDRVLTVAEVRAFMTILPECPMSETVRDVCRLVLRLGQRVNEVCRMRRRDLHLDDDYWSIPAAVAKNSRASRVPLPPAARRIIIEAAKRSGCEFVFPNKAGDGPLDPAANGGPRSATAAGREVMRARARQCGEPKQHHLHSSANCSH